MCIRDRLRGLAGAIFASQGQGHTLQPTALVNEAWLKLARQPDYEHREHFLAIAAKAMRQVLADHARAARAEKRGGERRRVTLDEERDGSPPTELDLVALDDALERLRAVNESYHEVFELRYLAGLDSNQTAHRLGVTPRTVQLRWRAVRAFLLKELGGVA